MHGESGDGPFDVDDSANAFLRCENGTSISLDVAWTANQPSTTEFVIHGEDAGERLDLAEGEPTIFETVAIGTPHFSDSTITTKDDDPHRSEQRHFIVTIQSSDPLTVNTVEQALVGQRVIDAIYQSSEANTDGEIDARPVLPVD